MRGPADGSWYIRLLLSFGAGLASAALVAIVVAVLDVYLTGNGMAPLNRPLLDWPGAGVRLGLGDVLLLAAVVLAAAITWRRTAGDGA